MNSLAFGARGTYINNTTTTATAADPFVMINALVDTSVILTTNWVSGTNVTVAMTAGQTLYGIFTSIQTTGTVVAYK